MRLEKRTDFAADDQLIAALHDLTRPSYEDNTSVLEREISHCRAIYLLYSDEEKLTAFFMVNYEVVDHLNTCYLGLSGCDHGEKARGHVKYLYNSFLLDCAQKEKADGQRILCWWTTATPVVYYWFCRNTGDCQPDIEGNVSPEGRQRLVRIAKAKYAGHFQDEQWPFLLRKVATGTHYSPGESERIAAIVDKLNIGAFRRYPIDEKQGDRYLMSGYAPAAEVVMERMRQHRAQMQEPL